MDGIAILYPDHRHNKHCKTIIIISFSCAGITTITILLEKDNVGVSHGFPDFLVSH